MSTWSEEFANSLSYILTSFRTVAGPPEFTNLSLVTPKVLGKFEQSKILIDRLIFKGLLGNGNIFLESPFKVSVQRNI